MARNIVILCFITLLSACGGTTNNAPSTTSKAIIVSNGDLSKFVGGWTSCTAQLNGSFLRNNISFFYEKSELFFSPVVGSVGTYSDAGCTLESGKIGIVTPIRILNNTTQTINLPTNPDAIFTGTVDALPDVVPTSFKFAGFSSDYKTLWFSTNIAFDGTAIRYNKL